MENGEKLTPEQLENYFKSDLLGAPAEVRERYHSLLLDEKIRMAKENGNRPAGPVSLKLREMMLESAEKTETVEDAKKAFKMERDWVGHTSKDGRPPIGGAPDD